jgi:hypothetical protein
MGRYSEWATVTPAPGEPLAGVAGALLAIAPDPSHVRTIRGGTAFLVHPDVAARYNPAPAAPKRRRRAPRKDEDA